MKPYCNSWKDSRVLLSFFAFRLHLLWAGNPNCQPSFIGGEYAGLSVYFPLLPDYTVSHTFEKAMKAVSIRLSVIS